MKKNQSNVSLFWPLLKKKKKKKNGNNTFLKCCKQSLPPLYSVAAESSQEVGGGFGSHFSHRELSLEKEVTAAAQGNILLGNTFSFG